MNPSTARCAVPGSTCRLLQLELPDPRPVWAALDAAGERRLTGELTLHLEPVVRVWFLAGEVYLAERDGDRSLADRLIGRGVVTEEELAAGTVAAGEVAHLGRLFERVPAVDRDAVELAVELQTAELLGEIADRIVPKVEVASYRHHASGVHRWYQRAHREPAHAPVAVAPSTISASVIDEVAALAARAAEQAAALPAFRLRAASGSVTPSERVEPPGAVVIDEAVGAPDETVVEPVDAPEASVIEGVEETLAALLAEAPTEPLSEAAVDQASVTTEAFLSPVQGMVDTADAEPSVAEPDTSPSPGAIELTRIIEHVAAEADVLPIGSDDPIDISEDVRAAVRQALAEIQAATRPAITDGLTVAGFLDATADATANATADAAADATAFIAPSPTGDVIPDAVPSPTSDADVSLPC